MRLRCDSTHAGHSCSHLLDWLGSHAGDHAAHPKHDLTAAAVATWPNDGAATRGIPVQAAAPASSGSGAVAPAPAPRPPAPKSAPKRALRDPYAYEITEWDLLPDA